MFRRFRADRGGANAVEFALVATPFLMLVFGVIELGLLFMASTTIESATLTAARAIRTGQMQQGGSNTAAGFKTAVCAGMAWITASDCAANVVVNVETFSNFSSIAVTPPIKNNQLDPSKTGYNPGGPCSIEVVQVFYPYTVMAPLLEPGMPNLGPDQRLITSTVAFRNEPYTGNASCS